MIVSPVLLAFLGFLLAALGAVVGMAIRWGAHAQGAAHTEKDITDLRARADKDAAEHRTENRELASRLRALEVSSIQQAALAQEISHMRNQSTERHEQVMVRLDRMETHLLAGARVP